MLSFLPEEQVQFLPFYSRFNGYVEHVNIRCFALFQNTGVMILGVVAFTLCSGYVGYMNYKNRKEKCYMSLNEDGTLTKRSKTSRWD